MNSSATYERDFVEKKTGRCRPASDAAKRLPRQDGMIPFRIGLSLRARPFAPYAYGASILPGDTKVRRPAECSTGRRHFLALWSVEPPVGRMRPNTVALIQAPPQPDTESRFSTNAVQAAQAQRFAVFM